MSKIRSRDRRRAGANEGSVAVEMALITPVLLLLAFGAVDYGVATDQQSALEGATRAGAEYAQSYYWNNTAFDSTGTNSQVTGSDRMFTATITPSFGSFCVCVDGSHLTNPCSAKPANPCSNVKNPYTQTVDPRFLIYTVVTAAQNYASPLGSVPAWGQWWSAAPAAVTLNAETVARLQ
jgi:Flp pilus assembly protein TadG